MVKSRVLANSKHYMLVITRKNHLARLIDVEIPDGHLVLLFSKEIRERLDNLDLPIDKSI